MEKAGKKETLDEALKNYASLSAEQKKELRKKNERFARKMQSGAATNPNQLRTS